MAHLEWCERMDVYLRSRVFGGANDGEVRFPGIAGMDAALHADFGRTTLPRFRDAPGDFFERQIVGFAAFRMRRTAFGKSAKRAAIRADIGVIDIAIDNVAHRIAARCLPQLVSRLAHEIEFLASRPEQADQLLFREGTTLTRLRHDVVKLRGHARCTGKAPMVCRKGSVFTVLARANI